MSDATCESKSHTLEGITGLQKKSCVCRTAGTFGRDPYELYKRCHHRTQKNTSRLY